MVCLGCDQPSSFRFCSNACFVAYAKHPRRAYVECALCQYNPDTRTFGNHNTHRICDDCREGDDTSEWAEPSEYEQRTDDIDTLVSISGGGVTIEAMFGGKRKADTERANAVLRIAKTMLVPRRQRRRTAGGWPARDYETVMVPPSERQIAEMAGCSRAYVRKLLRRVFG